MPALVLVKHSLPEIDSAVPANQWHLSQEGRLRSRVLGRRLVQYDIDVVVSSVEPKALETAQIAARSLHKPLKIVAGLHEHDRSNVQFLAKEQFAESIARFFARPTDLIFGKETASQAHSRFSRAVSGVSATYSKENVALITHGTVMSLFAGPIAGLEPLALWKQLGLPSWLVLSHPNFRLVEVCGRIDGGNDPAVG